MRNLDSNFVGATLRHARLWWIVALFLTALPAPSRAQEARPNILWISSEDNGPQLGAYGDSYATTPNLDRLASRGTRFLNVWANAPVCAPARTAIISGLYPSSTGSEHMRSLVRLPAAFRMFPALLRAVGYYTTNNVKEDYNLVKTADVWDDSSKGAHWRNRRPGQPFFAVFNITESHESQVRVRPHTWQHDPAKVRVPAYHPDTREVREDWAQYYDNLTTMDRLVGERLSELDAAGLSEDTIVVYFGDHGAGMPRSKRWPYNSGLHAPLLVYVPPKFRTLAPAGYGAGATSARLIGFVDFAPTMLSIAGVEPPAWMQGHAFMGAHAAPGPAYLFGLRGRMDERYDLVRTVRDERYVYIRNYLPHRIYGQYLWYMFETPTTTVWKRLYDAGKLKPPQTYFWESKPVEELYDLQTDPDEVRNLAASSQHRPVLDRMRQALDEHARAIRDVGFLPEYELHRSAVTPYERARDAAAYDFGAIRSAAMQASDTNAPLEAIRPALTNRDPVVRYWGATGVLARGATAAETARAELTRLLGDDAPGPRIAAAEALARFTTGDLRDRAIDVLVGLSNADRNEEYVAMLALNSLVQVDNLPPSVMRQVEQLPRKPRQSDQRENYITRLVDAVIGGLR